MSDPVGIIATAVYDTEQTCSVLRISESKLKQLIAEGRVHSLDFTTRRHFFGAELIRMLRSASHLPERAS